VRSGPPQNTPACLQSRYRDGSISALAVPNPETVWPALCRELAHLSFVIDFDCALDDVLESRVLGREGHAELQGATLHLTLSDDALDLPLRGDAHLLEELGECLC
jgi:hypothetical protein